MRAEAFAKINFALAVFPPSADGYHPLRGIFQSVTIADEVAVLPANEDEVEVSNEEAPADESNLAWRAFEAVRGTVRVIQPSKVSITKRIPSGAGLGGGSADAAAVLGLTAARFGLGQDEVMAIAEDLGADVPFAYVGGTKMVEGRGERLVDHEPLDGFALAVVVPPMSLATPAVFKEWDRLDSPEGPVMPDSALPPQLRGGEPMRNDLFPAAVSLDARVGEWADELSTIWSTSVAMTGSGSALYAFFATEDEAASAVADVTVPARLATACVPSPIGWRRIDD